jgi:hypothetical protein
MHNAPKSPSRSIWTTPVLSVSPDNSIAFDELDHRPAEQLRTGQIAGFADSKVSSYASRHIRSSYPPCGITSGSRSTSTAFQMERYSCCDPCLCSSRLRCRSINSTTDRRNNCDRVRSQPSHMASTSANSVAESRNAVSRFAASFIGCIHPPPHHQ